MAEAAVVNADRMGNNEEEDRGFREFREYCVNGTVSNDFTRRLDEAVKEAKMDTQTFVDYYRRQLAVQKQQLLGKEKGEKIGLEKGEKIGLEKGEKIGLEKGEKIGLEKGEKIGLEKGEKKGARKQQEETAKKMYAAGFGIDDISRFVSLSADELKKILE